MTEKNPRDFSADSADPAERLARRDRCTGAVAGCAELLLEESCEKTGLSEALALLGEAFGASACWVAEYSNVAGEPGLTAELVQAYPEDTASAGLPERFDIEAAGLARWIEEAGAKRSVSGPVEELPHSEKEFLSRRGVRAVIIAPVEGGKGCRGLLGMEFTGAVQCIEEAEVLLVESVARMIGAFLRRVRRRMVERTGEERLLALVESMPVMIFACDEDGRIVFWNRECERVTGYSFSDISKHSDPFSLLFREEFSRSEMYRMWQESEGGFVHKEWPVLTRDGARKVISWTDISPSFPLPGWAHWQIGVDISDRHRVEAQILQAKQEWERTFDSVTDLIALLDRDFRVRRLNMAFAERLQLHPKDLIGLPLGNLLDDSTGDAALSGAGRVSALIRFMAEMEGECSIQEQTIRKLGGRFLLTVNPYRTDAGERGGTVLVLHDISRWKALEEQLRQAQKLEALGTLAGGIAHDFNNILGVVMGYAEMALEELGVPPGQASDDAPASSMISKLREIMNASNRARDLIRQVLTFSRQDDEELRPIALGPLIKETLKLLRGSIPLGISLRQQILTELDTIEAAPTHIHSLLMNLCTNASHAIGQGKGTIEVSLVDSYVVEEGQPELPDLKPGAYVRLSVRDSGDGIDEETQKRIFDPFFTTKKPGEGTGMGLSMVHGIATRLGGGVRVESAPGQGTTLSVYLPRTDLPVDAAEEAEKPIPLGSGHVLLVDDEKALVEIGSEVLRSLGYEVTAVSDSQDALDIFRTAPEVFSAVFTDQTMPGMTGVELVGRMLEIRPDLPVVLSTGFSETLSYSELRELGVSEFIVKPVLKRQLAEALHRAVEPQAEDTPPD